MDIYVSTHGSKVGILGGKLTVTFPDDTLQTFPFNTIKSVTLLSTVQISSQAIEKLCDIGIMISWISSSGKIIGNIYSPDNNDTQKQYNQFKTLENQKFRNTFAQNIIKAKINNQRMLISRLMRNNYNKNAEEFYNLMKLSKNSCNEIKDISQLLGIEGNAAKYYFSALKEFIPEEFGFNSRTKHPPKDPVSSALSFTYTLLYRDAVIALKSRGFNTYVEIMHEVRHGHHALASDIMEEFRAVIADSVVIDFIFNKNTSLNDFNFNQNGNVYVNNTGLKKIIGMYENKMNEKVSYIFKNGYSNTYRGALYIQSDSLSRAYDEQNAELYQPIYTR